MKTKLTLLAVSIAAVFAFHWRAFLPWPELDMTQMPDYPGIKAGYDAIHSPADILRWFYGPWIHQDYPSLRPLSGMLYAAQIYTGLHFGWLTASLFMVALVTINGWLSAAIAYHFTRSHLMALLSSVLFISLAFTPHMTEWAQYPYPFLLGFALADNFLAVGFCQAALLAWLHWRETGNLRALAATWALFIAAALSKELAYILPAILGVLALLPATVSRRRAAMQSLLMCCACAALFAFRSLVIAAPHNAPRSRLEALQDGLGGWVPSPRDVFIMDALPALLWVGVYGAIVTALVCVWRHRSEIPQTCWTAAALWACVQLAYVPSLGFHLQGHYILFAAVFKCVLTVYALHAAIGWAFTYAQKNARKLPLMAAGAAPVPSGAQSARPAP